MKVWEWRKLESESNVEYWMKFGEWMTVEQWNEYWTVNESSTGNER